MKFPFSTDLLIAADRCGGGGSIIAAVSQRKKQLLFKPHHFQTHRHLHHKIQQAFIILQRFCFVKLCQGPINNAGAHYFKRNFSNIFCSTTMSFELVFSQKISESNLSKKQSYCKNKHYFLVLNRKHGEHELFKDHNKN